VAIDFKVCGLTRASDAQLATALGARYLGFIFAPSPRQLTLEQASALFAALDATDAERAEGAPRPDRVGVFAQLDVDTIATMAERLALDVIQLHDAAGALHLSALRARTGARIWTVVHVAEHGVDPAQLDAAMAGDGLLLDAKVDGLLGGTGRTFDWAAVRELIAPRRGERPIILAGGLRAENVARAIHTFAPDVVDVSSGVEGSPGRKDPARLRAFADAVHGVSPA
jgi:phosphoribosylanthranilate isomerase